MEASNAFCDATNDVTNNRTSIEYFSLMNIKRQKRVHLFSYEKLAKTKNLSFKRQWAVNIEDFTPEVSSALLNTLLLRMDGTNKDNISENLRLILLKCWHYMREYIWERSTQDAHEVKPVQCQTAPLDFQHRHLRPLWAGVLEYKRWPAVHLHSYPHWYLEIICSVVIGLNLWPKSI